MYPQRKKEELQSLKRPRISKFKWQDEFIWGAGNVCKSKLSDAM